MAPSENGDRRFANPAWQQYPFNVYAQAFQNGLALMQQSARGVEGVEPRNAQLVEFARRQAAESLSPTNTSADEPRSAAADGRRGRPEPGARLQAFPRRHGAHALGRRDARHRGFPRRRESRRHRRPGGLSQRADRADPVFADHARRDRRAGADRAGLDHEVLHPRPVAEELAGRLAGGPGPHGLHDVVEEPDRRRPRARHGRLPAQGHLCGARCRRDHRAGPRHPRGRLLHRRHAALGRRRRARRMGRQPHPGHLAVRRADGFQRTGRALALHQPGADRDARGADVQGRRARLQADGRRVHDAACARSACGSRR